MKRFKVPTKDLFNVTTGKEAKRLLAEGFDIKIRNENSGDTPFHHAVRRGRRAVVRAFLDSKAIDDKAFLLHSTTVDGITAIHLSVVYGHEKILKDLIANFAFTLSSAYTQSYIVNLPAEDCGAKPLHLAAIFKHFPIVMSLVAAGADVDVRDSNKRTPLHEATIGGNVKIVRFLVRAGADINARDLDGVTPLHIAGRDGRVALAKALVRLGADARARDNDCETPACWALASGHKALSDYLYGQEVAEKA